ncbi:MAG: A/G-specific adenine glycosylase, partial [Erysipelotrichaceae bacterium]
MNVITLQEWYLKNQRVLPFRLNRDPYRIWISEIMAQQTQIDTMLEYYTKWMLKWPDLGSFSSATLDEILKIWEGLGYYRRATNIYQALQIIKHEYHSTFPNNYQSILKLPGLGPYTAAAIASIAYDEKVVAIDGNVNRVISRYLGLTTLSTSSSFKSMVRTTM